MLSCVSNEEARKAEISSRTKGKKNGGKSQEMAHVGVGREGGGRGGGGAAGRSGREVYDAIFRSLQTDREVRRFSAISSAVVE